MYMGADDSVDAAYIQSAGRNTSFTSKKLLLNPNGGNVGIGTSSPGTQLTLNKNDNNFLQIRSSDTGNAGIYFGRQNDSVRGAIVYDNSNESIQFLNNNYVERMRINSSGNISIGTTTSTAKVNIAADSADGSQVRVYGATNENYQLRLGFDTTNLVGKIQAVHVGTAYKDLILQPEGANVGIGLTPSYPLHVGTSGAGIKGFFTNTTDADLTFNLSSGVSLVTPTTGTLAFGTSSTERMRIDSSGNVSIGTTSNSSVKRLHLEAGGTLGQLGFRNSGATSGKLWHMGPNANNHFILYNNAITGLYVLDGGTSWTAASDENLKENIVELTGALDKVKDYRCVEYNLISDETNSKKIGFIAQDWQEDYSQVVSQDEDGNLGLQYTETIPVLLKAIQEQQTQIEALQSEINLLKGE